MFRLAVACFVIVLFAAASCSGQDAVEQRSSTLKNQDNVAAIGEIVTELGDKITVVFQDSNDHYWFGGGKKGVYKYDGKTLTVFSIQDGLCSHSILGIQEDRLGNIFFDTLKGVSKFDGKKFTTLKVTVPESSNSEWKLEPDDLWLRMGWDKNGPYRYDGKHLYKLEFPKIKREAEFHEKLPNASWSPYGIYSLYQDSKGAVWFGTASLGLCRFDGKSISWLYEKQLTEIPGGGDFGIRSIIEDENGYFWICNSRFRYKMLPVDSLKVPATQIEFRKKNGVGYSSKGGEIEFPYFMSIAEDNQGDLWMATYDDGVWRSNGKKLVHYPVVDGKTDVLLFQIYKDRKGVLWLGTHNAGVFKFNGEKFERFLQRQ